MADAIPLVATDAADWHERRRQGIGASEVSAVLGWDPWTSPWALYLRKVGEVPDEEGDSEAQRWGRLLEAIIADEYSERTGEALIDPGETYRHGEHAWMFASPDRLILPAEREGCGQGLLEVKNVTAWKAGDWQDGPPKHYLAQWQWTAAVMGATWGAFAALVGGNRLVIVDCERDDEFVDLLVERAAEFWQRVQDRRPPPIDGDESTEALLKALYAEADPGSEVVVDDVVADAAVDYWRAHAAVEAYTREKRRAGNAIRAAMEDAEAAVLDDGTPVATWRQQMHTQFDLDGLRADQPDLAEKYTQHKPRRVLRPKKIKEAGA